MRDRFFEVGETERGGGGRRSGVGDATEHGACGRMPAAPRKEAPPPPPPPWRPPSLPSRCRAPHRRFELRGYVINGLLPKRVARY